jgi:hypothetical protein
MTFKLTKRSENKVKTTFFVEDDTGAICGSINVKNSEVPDLLRHWNGPADRPSRQPQSGALAKAFAKLGPMSKQAILRGC